MIPYISLADASAWAGSTDSSNCPGSQGLSGTAQSGQSILMPISVRPCAISVWVEGMVPLKRTRLPLHQRPVLRYSECSLQRSAMGLSGYCVARQHIVGTGKQGCNHTVHKFDVTRWCFNDSTTVPSVGSGFLRGATTGGAPQCCRCRPWHFVPIAFTVDD